jgi:hypothetical protein
MNITRSIIAITVSEISVIHDPVYVISALFSPHVSLHEVLILVRSEVQVLPLHAHLPRRFVRWSALPGSG